MRNLRRTALAITLAMGALAAATSLAGAITGGTNDDPTNPVHPNVGLVYFYQSDGRFRCSGTLIEPRVLLTAAHCTYGNIGKVAVTFDTDLVRNEVDAREVTPRAKDDLGLGDEGSGYTAGLWTVTYDAEGNPLKDLAGQVVREPYDGMAADPTIDGTPTWVTGTALSHPEYSDFTDPNNWNDTGVIILDEPIGVPVAQLAPVGTLDAIGQRALVKQLVRTAGYGTEVRQAEEGPQKPTPQSYPIRRQYTDEKPQKLTPQILQLNGNEHDPFGGGGTCFGDSGGPAFYKDQVVGDTSYGYTSNCRYLGGYQRVDIPVVRTWLDCVLGRVADTGTVAPGVRTPGARAAVADCGTKL